MGNTGTHVLLYTYCYYHGCINNLHASFICCL